MKEQEFVNKLAPIAVKDMQASGVLASVTIAQGILESGYGTTELAIKANNFFGMKCSLSGNTWESVWDGKSKYTKATEEQKRDGRVYTVTADFRKYPDMDTSVKDHSCYLTGAIKGDSLRYEGLKGERDYKKAIQIIKEGGYASDRDYVPKICSIIDKFNLTRYDVWEGSGRNCIKEKSVQIIEKTAVENPCYKRGTKITPKGLMLHSVGCPQPDPMVFAKNWQSSGALTCVHAFVGKEGVIYQLLPWNMKAWHCGSGAKGSGNNFLISLEMTEPATIKYTGGSNWIELGNGANTKAHVLATYANAVQVFALLCEQYSLNPLDDNVIMSHQEGYKKGIASNHGDVEHIWDKFGLSMNQFRKDVLATMNKLSIETVPTVSADKASDDTSGQKTNPLIGTVKVVYDGADGVNLRKAPSYVAEIDGVAQKGFFDEVVGISEDEKWYKLKSGLFISAIPNYVSFRATMEQKASTVGTGYYRVRKSWQDDNSQIGAFKDKNNAINLCQNNAGYKVYDNSGKEIYPLNPSIPENKEFKVRISISDLRIRKGPGTTYDYHKQGGKAVYTGKGEFTIVSTKCGQGAKLWGLLKSYKNKEDGWISLDDGVKIFDD